QLEMAVSDCHACFRVRDNGIGIQPEHMEQIFDMFYQADSSYGRKYMGTGLGLTIARSLTEKLGGRLEVESIPGVSTVFSVFLPLDLASVGEEIMEEAGRR
ncbi:MAG TPA: ATP-binding protein, partial [Candidatus Obscuribacterales bacterium]